ncbi:hypothetical protein [Flavobacterium sp. I-STPA6A]|uniref:hypothetical protein n=1 Tax=Flavobacterium sp. I-STPA6A TaxID=2590450 RepID=UPI00131BDFF5|nr:hypothetical protein [Flavobacterium sp. I-STPA6A]
MKKILTAIILLITLNSFSQKINSQLLQGKWQSLDDKTNFLVFTKDFRKEIAEGMDSWDIEKYTLSKGSGNKIFINQLIDNKNMSIWGIESLDNNKLTLFYLSRGNFLRYRRVK